MEFDLLHMLYILLPSIGGGLIQGATGFGSGIFVMMFFPLFLPVLKSSALASLLSIFASLPTAIRYRKHITPKIVILPAIFYFAAAALALRLAKGADFTLLKAILGLFLMIISLYFMFVAGKIHIKANLLTALICGTISGVGSGLFGIGGPPMVIYILAITGDDKEAYIGNSQFFFALAALYTTSMRLMNGIITLDFLPLAVPGMIGMLLGKNLGIRIVERINVDMMKKLIYGFLFFSGLTTFLTNI